MTAFMWLPSFLNGTPVLLAQSGSNFHMLKARLVVESGHQLCMCYNVCVEDIRAKYMCWILCSQQRHHLMLVRDLCIL